jgi:hypothetical protein
MFLTKLAGEYDRMCRISRQPGRFQALRHDHAKEPERDGHGVASILQASGFPFNSYFATRQPRLRRVGHVARPIWTAHPIAERFVLRAVMNADPPG